MNRPWRGRDWTRYALALDMYLEGKTQAQVARTLGLSRERARQMITSAAHQLAYRVFKNVPRRRWIWNKQCKRWKQGL